MEANCLVKGFKKVWSLPDKTYGVPRLHECRRVERQSIGENGSTPQEASDQEEGQADGEHLASG